MNTKKVAKTKTILTLTAVSCLLGIVAILVPATTFADNNNGIPAGCPGSIAPVTHSPSCPTTTTTPTSTTTTTTSTDSGGLTPLKTGDSNSGSGSCGKGSTAVTTSINFGCTGKENGVMDLFYAVIRFLSAGVGIVLVGSVVFAGIQYSTARGDPQATAKALARISATGGALLLYLFIFALLNYLVPGGLLN